MELNWAGMTNPRHTLKAWFTTIKAKLQQTSITYEVHMKYCIRHITLSSTPQYLVGEFWGKKCSHVNVEWAQCHQYQNYLQCGQEHEAYSKIKKKKTKAWGEYIVFLSWYTTTTQIVLYPIWIITINYQCWSTNA